MINEKIDQLDEVKLDGELEGWWNGGNKWSIQGAAPLVKNYDVVWMKPKWQKSFKIVTESPTRTIKSDKPTAVADMATLDENGMLKVQNVKYLI